MNKPQALKRKLSEVEGRLEAHEELYRIIQSRPEEDGLSILRRIRQGHDVDTILRHLKDGDLLVQLALGREIYYRYDFPSTTGMPYVFTCGDNPYLTSLIYKRATEGIPSKAPCQPNESQAWLSNDLPYRVPYHAAKIIEHRLSYVKPSEWTTVSTNNDLLRELLQFYFLYQYPFFAFFHKDFFLEDMATKNKRFCSSLLVNAVLAAACVSVLCTNKQNELLLRYRTAANAHIIAIMPQDCPPNGVLESTNPAISVFCRSQAS